VSNAGGRVSGTGGESRNRAAARPLPGLTQRLDHVGDEAVRPEEHALHLGVEAGADHHEILRRNHAHDLAATPERAHAVEGHEPALPEQPELRAVAEQAEGAVAGEAGEAGGSRRRRRREVGDPAFGEHARAVPAAVVQQQQAEAREVARGRLHLAAQHEAPAPVGLGDGVAHADPVEERAAREGPVGGIVADHVSQRAHQQQRVAVRVEPARAGLDLELRAGDLRDRLGAAEVDGLRRRSALFEPAAHVQQVGERDLRALVARRLPLGDRGGRAGLELALADQDADQRSGDRLGHGPGAIPRVGPEARAVALADDAAALHDHDADRLRVVAVALAVEGGREHALERLARGGGRRRSLALRPGQRRRSGRRRQREGRERGGVGARRARRQRRAAEALALHRDARRGVLRVARLDDARVGVDGRVGEPVGAGRETAELVFEDGRERAAPHEHGRAGGAGLPAREDRGVLVLARQRGPDAAGCEEREKGERREPPHAAMEASRTRLGQGAALRYWAGMRCFVALGSNLGDREAELRRALARLGATPGVEVVAVSRLYETEPVGPPQPPYLNAAAALESTLDAQALLARLLAIEREAGRTRGPERNTPRALDLDLLLFGSACREEPELTLPHPRLHERAFVLEPLAEIAAEVEHPRLGLRIGELAERARDPRAVRPYAPRGPWP
jgi:2-amino-4-hydroxy-6-hydroxymethyldihydropteridine diphosphokinase